MKLTSERRTVLLILGIVMLWTLVGPLGTWFNNSTSAGPQMPPLNVLETNLDADGFIRVHDQGTVSVSGTVNVANTPAVQDVFVTNATLPVSGSVSVNNLPAATGGVTKISTTEVFPFDTEQTVEVDIHEYARVRAHFVVNGSGTVDFFWFTDAGLTGSFSLDAGEVENVLLPEVAGTKLSVHLTDPDGEQVFVIAFGSN